MTQDFQEIFEQFQPKILNYLTKLFNNRTEAEDLTQEVFIKVNKGLKDFQGKSSLSTWIYKIASNVANDRFRSSSYQKGMKRTTSDEFLEDKEEKNVWTGEKEPLADQKIAKKEMSTCIERYINDLNENYKTVFILSEYEGLKNDEIAETLNLSLETVKIRLHRARTQLKKRMESGCEISTSEDSELFCDEK